MLRMPIQAPMMRVIRNRETGRFFKDGDWTDEMDDATSFTSIIEVGRVCARYKLTGVELLLRYPKRDFDITIPICEM